MFLTFIEIKAEHNYLFPITLPIFDILTFEHRSHEHLQVILDVKSTWSMVPLQIFPISIILCIIWNIIAGSFYINLC